VPSSPERLETGPHLGRRSTAFHGQLRRTQGADRDGERSRVNATKGSRNGRRPHSSRLARADRTTWIVAAGKPLVCHYQMPGLLGDPYERGGAVKLLSVVLPSGSEDPLYGADARDKRQYGSGLPDTETTYST
jgi:hypothetical protein